MGSGNETSSSVSNVMNFDCCFDCYTGIFVGLRILVIRENKRSKMQ